MAPFIPKINTIWLSVVTFTPRPLYLHGGSSLKGCTSRLGGPQGRSEDFEGGKKSRLTLQGLETWSLIPQPGNYTEYAVPP